MADVYTSSREEVNPESVETKAGKNNDLPCREEAKSKNPLSAFRVNPLEVSFGIQEEKEKIILLLRKHWVTNFPWLVISLVLFFAPSLLSSFPLLDFLPARFQFMAIIVWYLLVIAFMYEKFITWFFNVYIVTDERVIDVDFYNLIYKQVAEAKTDKIQDTTYRVGGVLRSLFNFGNVLIETAGAETNLEFEDVPNPDQVVRVLDELRTEEEKESLERRVR